MDIETALKNIEGVLAVFKGTLQDHKNLQDSIAAVKQALEKNKKEDDKKA